MDKNETIILDDFQKRFIRVIESQSPKYWMSQLGIQSNLLWGWKKGNYPGLRYAIDICVCEGVSPNWLLLGVGPMYVEDVDGLNDDALLDANVKEDVLADIMSMKKRIEKLHQKKDQQIMQILSGDDVMDIFRGFSDSFSSEKDLEDFWDNFPSHLSEKLIVPLARFLNLNAGELAETLKEWIVSESGGEVMKGLIRWIIEKK